jgi:hypothetical protein
LSFNALARIYGWRLIQKSRGLSDVMRYVRPHSEIDCIAVELSCPVAGTHKQSEMREYTTTWVKDGVTFEHFYPNYEGIKELEIKK